ncbi:MAG TPA: hypothetical protein VHE59_00500 [Mucilaginibacter sp.]|nr:hypothetical protein [Mucilaginibacter sp.]
MRKSFLILSLLLFLCKTAFCVLPDSLVINDSSWAFGQSGAYKYVLVKENNRYTLYEIKFDLKVDRSIANSRRLRLSDVSGEDISNFCEALENKNYTQLKLSNFGYENNWVTTHPNTLFSYVRNKYKHWTESQIAFAKAQLTNPDNYQKALNRLILKEGYAVLAIDGGSSFDVTLYYQGYKAVFVKASENPLGMPWHIDSANSFNPAIPELLARLIPNRKWSNQSRFNASKSLMKELARQIYDDNCETKMRELSALSFTKEIGELKRKFNVASVVEYAYYSRYISPKGQTFLITLKNDSLPQGAQILYFLSRVNNTLYSRDFLFKDFDRIKSQVERVRFIIDFLKANTSRKLNIGYFDNKAVSESNIEGFNTDPKKWEEHDKMAKIFASIHTSETDSARQENNKVSLQVDCGCNFRFNNNYLKKAIFLELIDEDRNSSVWILMPDGTPILWFFDGERVYKYPYQVFGTDGRSIQYACKKFNLDGTIVK